MPNVNYKLINEGPSQSIKGFQFTLRSSDITSGSLATAGAKTITLRRAPLGISGSNVQHYIYISGGVGTAEAVLITGGTCTSGNLGGTLTFTTVNTHTGDWKITSSTDGMQEWFYGATAPLNGFIPDAGLVFYAKCTLYGRLGATVQITGGGDPASRVRRHSSYPSGDLILYNSTLGNGQLIMKNFSVLNANGFDNPSGAGIHLIVNQPFEALLRDITVYNGVNPIVVDPQVAGTVSSGVIFDNVYVSIQGAYSSVYTTGHGITLNTHAAYILNTRSSRDTPTATGGSGLKIIRADGIVITGGAYNGTYGIEIENNSAYIMNFIYASNVIFDACYSHGFYVAPGAHNVVFSQFKIENCHFATQSGSATASAIYFGNDVESVAIIGNNISGQYGSGITLGVTDKAPRSVTVAGNNINNCGLGGTGYGIVLPATGSGGSGSYEARTTITGNVIGNNITFYGAATQQVGIYLAGATGKFRGYNITGNDVRGNVTAPIFKDPTPTMENVIISANSGVDDLFTVIASASLSAAGATGVLRNIEVSGTTNVTSLTPVWDGRQITIVKTDAGTVNFTAAGNIAAAVSIAQYGRLDFIYYVALGKWIGK
ncbi:MAG: hypothetical protein EBR82_07305 [Caulobacteraceae bacterium]|nr:hypothetical protein [Caulobacteraceae bacterium]